jgi:hypothetical protein
MDTDFVKLYLFTYMFTTNILRNVDPGFCKSLPVERFTRGVRVWCGSLSASNGGHV